MTSPPTGTASPPPTSTSTPPPTPLLLLKTRNTPTDAYDTYFSPSPSASATTTSHLQPTFIPVLQHAFLAPSLSHLHALLSLPARDFPYGGLICTSQRAVEALGQVLEELAASATPLQRNSDSRDDGNGIGAGRKAQGNGDRGTESPAAVLSRVSDLHLPLYTVGPATARALAALQQRHLPRCRVLGRDTGNGANLAAFILAHYAPPPLPALAPPADCLVATNAVGNEAARAPLLFLVGEQRRDVIPRTLASRDLAGGQRVRVDELVVYETRVREGFRGVFEGRLRGLGVERGGGGAEGTSTTIGGRSGGGGGPVWVAVFSPTGCAEMVKVLRERRGRETSSGESNNGRDGGSADQERHGDVFVASIGPTTRDYLLEEFDFRVDVCAERPSPEGLAEGIAQFMREKGLQR
ncbi:hypothetical protein MMC18_005830 [Xylographa bjoerkii]|nr:hypothetical protein [Xylographa bjoerkii]